MVKASSEEDWEERDGNLYPVAITRRLLGLDAAALLIREYGSRKIYFPINPGQNHWLSQLFDHAAALKLAEEIGGLSMHVGGRNSPIAREVRDSVIISMVKAGAKRCDIGRAIHVGERQLSCHLARLRRDGQLSSATASRRVSSP